VTHPPLGISAPMIVDIDWRLDYSIRSKHGGRNNIPMYFVCLKVKDRGLMRNVEMIASLEEMQDLLASV
jgi:COMM domain containing 3